LGRIREETKRMKPTDKAILGMVSKSPADAGVGPAFFHIAQPSVPGYRCL